MKDEEIRKMNDSTLLNALVGRSQYGAVKLFIHDMDEANEAFKERTIMVDELLKRLSERYL